MSDSPPMQSPPPPDTSVLQEQVRLPTSLVRELSRVSSARGWASVAREWGGILLAVRLCQTFWSPPLYVLAVVWIGTRQHALAILMHEATHSRLLANKRWNDGVGEALLAWPLLTTLHAYRENHFAHHRYANTPRDPDWVRKQGAREFEFPKTRRQLGFTLLGFLSGGYAFKLARQGARLRQRLPQALRLPRVVAHASLLLAAVRFGFGKSVLLYWGVPLATVFATLMYIRTVAEHLGSERLENSLLQTRHVEPAWWERILVGPHHVNFHLDHHLYPSVPCHRLPALHRLLVRDSLYQRRAHVTRGYFSGLFQEMTQGAVAGR